MTIYKSWLRHESLFLTTENSYLQIANKVKISNGHKKLQMDLKYKDAGASCSKLG